MLRVKRQRLGLSQAKLAELCGISQHLLSAYELEKAAIEEGVLDVISAALSDDSRVSELAQRAKRYREHTYAKVRHVPSRVAKATRTLGNEEYVALLSEIARKHGETKSENLNALSLFSGCGGFSLGFSAGGFAIKGFLEIEAGLRATYKENFGACAQLGGDITKVSDEQLAALPARIGPIDAIIGGPPCQGFSLSGKRDVDDPRNTLFRHYLRFVDIFQPKFAVLENVRLLTSMKSPSGALVKDNIAAEFGRHGYAVKCFEVNAKNYGVPQHRERALFIAIRSDLKITPSLPELTHSNEAADMFSKFAPLRTFGDACSDLPYLESGESSDFPHHAAVNHPQHVIEWLWDVPQGQSAHDNETPEKRPPSGYNTTYKRQVWDEPASTVQTTFGMISGCRNVHPIATRSLTVREAARIQAFPDSYHFVGNIGDIRTGIGNAVPPLMAYRIAEYACEVIKSCKSTRPQG
ncbi:MAG: DNA (cytosine-5-)-methyltransferase [Planctomycetes bacterium]|nr:DNA (cytosine-5-)-methyltransferase [Planctomycetota bacterium]